MKHLLPFILCLAAVCALCACERGYSGDEDVNDGAVGVDGGEGASDGGNGGWYDDDIPADGAGMGLGDRVDVATFKNTPIYTQVWVEGYIVGAATGAKGRVRYEFGPEFSFDTALLLSDDPGADSEDGVMTVCLTGSSKMRAELNLKDHPENRGRRLAVFGFQDVYLGLVGVKTVDGYEFPAK